MKTRDDSINEPFQGELVLASSSPRRIELLEQAGYRFRVVPPGVEESTALHLTPRELSTLNAKRKAHAVAAFSPKAVVLGADTVVALHGNTFGKPSDMNNAAQMLSQLSGRTHQVVTSVWIIRLYPFQCVVFSEVSEVTFYPLRPDSIANYLKKINPLDKAGAYAAQEFSDEIIVRISGSRTNVIGLPMKRLAQALAEFTGDDP